MTNRINPTTGAEHVEQSAEHVEPTEPIDALLALDVESVALCDENTTDPMTNPDVTAIVRELSDRERRALVVEIATDHPTHAALTPYVIGAPTGPDPRESVQSAIRDALDTLAALVLGADRRGTYNRDAIAHELAAAMVRVAPDVESAERAERPARRSTSSGERRTRRRIVRDYSGAGGQYETPGRTTATTGADTTGARVTVTPNRSDPHRATFTATDPAGERRSFTTATPALQWADGWTLDGLRIGHGNPYEHLRSVTSGETLGARAPEVHAS